LGKNHAAYVYGNSREIEKKTQIVVDILNSSETNGNGLQADGTAGDEQFAWASACLYHLTTNHAVIKGMLD